MSNLASTLPAGTLPSQVVVQGWSPQLHPRALTLAHTATMVTCLGSGVDTERLVLESNHSTISKLATGATLTRLSLNTTLTSIT